MRSSPQVTFAVAICMMSFCKSTETGGLPLGRDFPRPHKRKPFRCQEMTVFDPGGLDEYDALVLNNTTRLKFDDPKRRETLISFVKGGSTFCGPQQERRSYEFRDLETG